MPLSPDTKERILGHPDRVTPESEELRRKAKWHIERAGGLKHAKMAKAAPMLFHAELGEEAHDRGDDDLHEYAFRHGRAY